MPLKNILKKALPVLKGIAPAAAAALSGPYAPIVLGIAKGLLGENDLSDDQILAQIAEARPEDLFRLRELDAQVELERERLRISREQMYLSDVQSARERHERVQDKEPARLTYIAMGALVTVVVAFTVISDMTEAQAYLFGVLTGGLLELVGKAYNFFFGSSQGSKLKTEQIAEHLATLRSEIPSQKGTTHG